ncbi:MAG: arylsulfotransferase family protein [Solirubrobacteraceae bacterium]
MPSAARPIKIVAILFLAVLCFSGATVAVAKTKKKPAPAPKAPSGPPPVYVFPIPNGHFASPGTQLTFRGVPASQLGTISVIGSSSGVHTGTIAADSDGDGGSFIPSTPFTPGETVTVTTSLNIEGSGRGSYAFSVATPAGTIPPAKRPAAPRVPGDIWLFHSRPDLAPAAVTITKRDPSATGDIFLAPQIGPLQQGPELIGPNGGLIWFDPVPQNDAATDFREQYYDGQPVLTWWQGNEAAGVGSGEDIILNSSYQEIKVVTAGNGLTADLHEFQLTPRGTALITAAFPVVVNASSVKGSTQEVVLDAVIQEIDIPTGLVLFQWDSLDHVPLTASYSTLPTKAHTANNVAAPFDYFHVNSIEPDLDGNLLISGRNTWAVYKVNRSTGAVMWTLGGKSSSFRLGPGASFAFQHDVRVQAFGDQFLTMFDDGAGPPYVHSQSRALKLELNLKHMTADVVSQRLHSPPLLSSYEGNDEQLPGRDDFVGWGQQPYFSQYNAQGKLVFDGRFVDDNISYRAYRFQWTGTPTTPPAVATARHGPKMTVYVSWNGATNVVSWRVFGGGSATALKPIVTAPKKGFETAITAGARRYVAVQALGFKGRPLGSRSAVVQVPAPPPPPKPKPKPKPKLRSAAKRATRALAAKPTSKPSAKKTAANSR